jgi:ubiquinone/menaquinone biosynthesis C-methylase UbiE
LQSNLQRIDAEILPFEDESFVVVYSWGVIHHSEKPERIIAEIKRVLKPGGVFIGMLYNRHSLVVLKLWVKYGLLKGKPFRSFADLVWNHMESVGTKAYTVPELTSLFSSFREVTAKPVMTIYDTGKIPSALLRLFSERWGWFVALKVIK